jgi:tetratricopeptide (TPR) repeat protein
MFLRGPVRARALRLVPLLLTMLIVPMTLTGTDRPLGEIIGGIVPATRGYPVFSRLDYLLTQFSVVAMYVRLLFLPVNQNLDYDYPIYDSFFIPPVFLSFIFILGLFGLAVYFIRRSGRGNPGLRLLAFGIFWFFITLSVESSIVPLPTIINEYRVYLPSMGAVLALTALLFLYINKLKSNKVKVAVIVFLILMVATFSYAAHLRNKVWQSEVSLWEDATGKSPGKARPHRHLGGAYARLGDNDRAKEEYLAALEINPDSVEAHSNLGVLYEREGRYEEAAKEYRTALGLFPDFAVAHFNLGLFYKNRGMYERSEEEYLAALRINPGYAEAHNNLGAVYYRQGRFEEAVGEFQSAARLKPENADYQHNLRRALEMVEQRTP